MPKFRFVRELSEAERLQLDYTFRSHSDFGVLRRAHAVLLSANSHLVGQLQDLLEVDRDTVSLGITRYESSQGW